MERSLSIWKSNLTWTTRRHLLQSPEFITLLASSLAPDASTPSAPASPVKTDPRLKSGNRLPPFAKWTHDHVLEKRGSYEKVKTYSPTAIRTDTHSVRHTELAHSADSSPGTGSTGSKSGKGRRTGWPGGFKGRD